MIKKISLILMAGFYLLAGINHFVHPANYYLLIPPFLPFHHLINIVSGLAEITLALLLPFSCTRGVACYGIILLLILFIPAHVYMIQKGGCIAPGLCVVLWVAWIRLIPLQFILMLWAWWHRNKTAPV